MAKGGIFPLCLTPDEMLQKCSFEKKEKKFLQKAVLTSERMNDDFYVSALSSLRLAINTLEAEVVEIKTDIVGLKITKENNVYYGVFTDQ